LYLSLCIGVKLGRLPKDKNTNLKVFGNRVLRRIFGEGEETGGWRKLHNEECTFTNERE
jgi:hypothetical protein